MRAIPQKAENSNQPILPARPKVVYAHRNPNTHQELTVMSIPSQSSMPPSTQVTPSMLNPRLAPSLGRRTQRSECSTQDEEIENEAKRVKIATNEGGKSVDDGIISFNSNESRNGSDKSSTQEKSLNRFAKWRNPKNQPSQKSISQSTVTHPSSAADPPLQTEQTSKANSQCSIAHQSSQSIQLRHPPKSQQKPQPYLVSQPDLDSLLDDVDLEGIEDLDSDLGNEHLHRQITQTGSASDGTLQINVDANSIKANGGITSTYSTRDQAIGPPISEMDTSGKLRRFSFKKPAALSNTAEPPSVNPNPNSTFLPSHQSSMRYSTETASRPPATRDLAVDATNARLASDRQSQPKFKFKPLNSQVNPSLVTSQQSLNHPPEDNISSATSAPESLKTPVNVMVNSNFQSAAGVTIAKGSKRDDSGIGDMDLDVDDEIDLDLDDALLDDLDVSGFQAATNLTSNLKAVRSKENQSTMGSAPLSTHLEVKSSMRGTVGARGNGANSGFGAGHMGVLKNVHTLIAEDDLEGLLDGLDELDDL
ncbi:hypothetical protein BKA69DRAFT_1151018 [Paraphysoderma sedebokerense]|nr:hypothetical protein BKA69DRAFT_1151018 [Paraphysoderma sedebokerense]